MSLKVMPNEVAGWDVVREDEGVALSNHPTREQALEAAEMRAEEERVGDMGDTEVEVDADHVHAIDDTRQGMKPAFLAGGGAAAGDHDPDRRAGPHGVAHRLRQLSASASALQYAPGRHERRSPRSHDPRRGRQARP